jgi:electron transport complex protein RnfE
MSKALGAFIPLIIANCIILGRVEAFALRNALLPSVVDALGMGLGFAWGLTFLGAVRELLTAGSVFGVRILSEQFPTCLMIALPAGGFLVFGLLLAGMNELERRAKIRGGKA